MNPEPVFSVFAEGYEAGRPQVVWTRLIADLETPVSAMLKLADGRPNSFLLESVEGGALRGRYSFIGLNPDLIWRCDGDRAEVNRNAEVNPQAFESEALGALASLRAVVEESAIDIPEELPPMAAGLVGYMSYDMVRLMERLPEQTRDVLGVPDGVFVRPTVMAVFDNVDDTIVVITPVRPNHAVDAGAAYARAGERLAAVMSGLSRGLPDPQAAPVAPHGVATPSANMRPEQFCDMVRKGKEYILAGDVFQVVLSLRFAVPFRLPAFSLYRALRRLNPSPFLFFLDFGGYSLVGSSPEIMVRLRGNRVTIRPLAGSRPRGKDAAEDQALAEEMLADPKERAEHLMLLDLGRNDVGRVAKVGTVEVTEQFAIERYSHIMHIVSHVEGEIDPKFDGLAALIAGFPAGTVSGAPKVRAMEIIEELEDDKRGVYAGCIGYFGANGDMDTCITLRTSLLKDGMLYVQAGCGVVADSDPEAEYQESCNKAAALLRAAEEATKLAAATDVGFKSRADDVAKPPGGLLPGVKLT